MDTVATPQRNASDGPEISRPGKAALLETVSGLLRELRAGAAPPPVELDSNLERDLGLDSLERAELLLRLERVFGIRLPVRTLATAETSRDLLRAVLAGAVTAGAPAVSSVCTWNRTPR